MASFPYADRFPVNRTLPEQRPRRATRSSPSSQAMATEEDAFWETGKCSGTMYCGDHEHYDFMNEAFGLFAHVNALQRDMCPSADQVRGRDHRHDPRPAPRRRGHRRRARRASSPPAAPAASSTRVLAYREHARQTPRHRPGRTSSSPRPAHPAFDKALPPVRHRGAQRAGRPRRRRRSTSAAVADLIDDQTDRASSARPATTATAPSTRSTSCRDLALERGVGLHVDGCLGGFILPFGQELGYDIPVFDFRLPGRHQHLGRHPQVRLRVQGHVGAAVPRQGAAQRASTSSCTDWTGGKYCSPGHRGLPLRRAARRHVGVDGAARPRGLPAATPRRSSRPPTRCRTRCASHPELRIMGDPTFCFSFTSDEFDIYHVNDFMRTAGLAVQRPAVPERASTWRSPGRRPSRASPRRSPTDLAEAVAYAKEHARRDAAAAGAIYGGVAGGLDRRGRRVHPSRHGRHARQPAVASRRDRPDVTPPTATSRSSSPSTSARAGPRSGSSRSPGAGRLAATTCPVDDATAARRRRGRRTPSEWWQRHRATPCAARWRAAPSTPTGSWPSASPASGPARCRSTRPARPVGRLRHVDGHAAARRYVAARSSAARSPATRRGRWPTWVRRTGGAPSPGGADPSATCSTCQHDQPDVRRGRPLVPRAGRLPGRCGSPASPPRQPRVDDRAPGSPTTAASTASPTTTRWCAAPASTPRKLPPLRRRPARSSAPCAPTSPPTSASRAGVQVVHRHARPALRGGRRGRASRDGEAHMAISTTSWISVPGAVQEDRRPPRDRGGPRPRRRPYLSPTTTTPPGLCLQWLRDSIVAPDDGLPSASAEPVQLRGPDGAGGDVATRRRAA